jgi:CrcB protein
VSLLAASLAGAAGAVCRYVVSGWAQTRYRALFPVGTLVVNVVGSFGLGVVVGGGDLDSPVTLAVVGFFGGFTTFSTWMIETIRLGLKSPRAMLNLALNLAAGLLAAAAGFNLTN